MKDKVLETKSIIDDILNDSEELNLIDLESIKEALGIIEESLEYEMLFNAVFNNESKKKLISDIEGIIGAYKEDIKKIRSKAISYQLNEGLKVIEMLEGYIEKLSALKLDIETEHCLDLVEPFNHEKRFIVLKDKLLNIIKSQPNTGYFLSEDGQSLNFERVDKLFSLFGQGNIIGEMTEIIGVARRKNVALNELSLREARLHVLTSAKDNKDMIIDYLAKMVVLSKQNSKISTLKSDIKDSKKNLNDLLSETELFQLCCKKLIDQDRQELDDLEFAKQIAIDIKKELEEQLAKFDLEFNRLGLTRFINKLVNTIKFDNGVTIPAFLRQDKRCSDFSLVSEKAKLMYINREIDENYEAANKAYSDANEKYNLVFKDYESAYDTLSQEARDFIKDDLDLLINLFDFIKSIKSNNYSALISLLVLKLFNDVNEVSYDDMCTIFFSEDSLRRTRDYYSELVDTYVYSKTNELGDIQDKYMLDSQGFAVYSKCL